jgi:hypothetical protein
VVVVPDCGASIYWTPSHKTQLRPWSVNSVNGCNMVHPLSQTVQRSAQSANAGLHRMGCSPVFELPGGLGVEPPQLFAQPPQTRCPGIPRGSVSTPPPLLMMLNCLCVMTMTMNRQVSTPPTYFLTIQTLLQPWQYTRRGCVFHLTAAPVRFL